MNKSLRRQFCIIRADLREIIAFDMGDRISFLGEWSCLRPFSGL